MNSREEVAQSVKIGFGKAAISVVNHVSDDTVYQTIRVDLDSPMVGMSSISIYEILPGDYQNIADMFNLLAAEERVRKT